MDWNALAHRILNGVDRFNHNLETSANSMFTNGYLTTGGQAFKADKQMIEAAGFEVGHLVNA